MPPSNAMPPVLHGFSAIAPNYDVILCDIWGVLHDGLRAHPGAGDALKRFRAGGGTVVLVSNAPRPSETVVPHLDQLGVIREAWDGIVTSGDVTRAMLAATDEPYFWLGPDRDAPLFDGFTNRAAPFEAARMIVCSGLIDDTRETPADYAAMLASARSRAMRFLCANPDLIVERGNEIIYCAGAIAEAYADIGGEVLWAGKPHRPVYDAALDVAASMRKADTPLSRVLAIGDALRTDVAGARGIGIDSIFIARGIHTHELGLADGPLTDARLAAFLADAPEHPSAAMEKLVW
jgi:HAD superfamily hydrolase (TIGR01459 family)